MTGIELQKTDVRLWWLRSPGRDQRNASDVLTDGALSLLGDHVYGVDRAVRPALRIIF